MQLPAHFVSPAEPASMTADGGTHAIVSRALAGDPRAADELARRLACVPAFVRTFNRRVGRPLSDDELEDVTQSALAAIWSKLERYDGGHALEGWAFGFCGREVLYALRKRRRPVDVDEEAAPIEDPTEPIEELDRVQSAVTELDPPESDIVRLKHFDEQSFSEIAERLHMPLGSVKTCYYRAVGRLRVRLASLWREVR